MKIIKLFFFIFLLSQSACVKPVQNMNDAILWFKENKFELVSINKLLADHPSIRRIDTNLRQEFVPKYANFSEQDYEVYTQVLDRCKQIGIKNVEVTRRGGTADGELIATSFTLFSSGFASSGHAINAEYVVDEALIEKAGIGGLVYIPQSLENWYLVEY